MKYLFFLSILLISCNAHKRAAVIPNEPYTFKVCKDYYLIEQDTTVWYCVLQSVNFPNNTPLVVLSEIPTDTLVLVPFVKR